MKSVVEDQNIVVLKADMTEDNLEVDNKLIELGNTSKAIPYYAVLRPGKPPHHFKGNFTLGGAKEFLDTAGISHSGIPKVKSESQSKVDGGAVADAGIVPAG